MSREEFEKVLNRIAFDERDLNMKHKETALAEYDRLVAENAELLKASKGLCESCPNYQAKDDRLLDAEAENSQLKERLKDIEDELRGI